VANGPKAELLRAIPSVERLLGDPSIVGLADSLPRWIVVDAVRDVLAETRQAITEGRVAKAPEPDDLAKQVGVKARILSQRGIRRVINATGVVIHTNLGRSILAEAAIAAVKEVARSYSSLEFDLVEGTRTSRTATIDALVSRVAGSEDGFAVNNNAAALLLALNTLAFGKQSIVSRGELVEIGGSFRLPDVMEKSGTELVEVGTTNRTRLEDYEAAITQATAVILKVHHSNFAMTGYVESPSRRELADLAHGHGLVLVEDLGSGALVDLSTMGISREPMPEDCIADGADVVTFSGDKLLGGPQAGLIVGKRSAIEKMKLNPLARALRLDKMTLAALEETLRLYLEPANLPQMIPTLRMLACPLGDLEHRAGRAAETLAPKLGKAFKVGVARSTSQVGGGSLPLADLETSVVSLEASEHSADEIIDILRRCEVPIIARIVEGRVYIDFRTVQPSEDDLLTRQVTTAFAGGGIIRWEGRPG